MQRIESADGLVNSKNWIYTSRMQQIVRTKALRAVHLSISLAAVALSMRAPQTCFANGNDGLKDIYEISDPEIVKIARATVALFHASKVEIKGDSAVLQTSKLINTSGISDFDRFKGQPLGAFCSGGLVGPDLVLSAAHCISTDDECKNTKFIFDFALYAPGQSPKIAATNVYSCTKILKKQYADMPKLSGKTSYEDFAVAAEWSLIKLDRAVQDRPPLPISQAKATEPGTPIFVIGYPYGLPAKFSGLVKLLPKDDDEEWPWSYSDVLVYPGNSGSLQINAKTKEVIGVVTDHNSDNSARITKAKQFVSHLNSILTNSANVFNGTNSTPRK